MDRIFINLYGYSNDWIMGKIADDIFQTAKKLGYDCRCGEFEDYDGEEICYHLNYPNAVAIPKAKHNSVFYTHLNNLLSEENIVSMKDQFDSFVCMSPEDAQFLVQLGFDKNIVFGKTLPVRNSYIKPSLIGIFSACYEDGRKNEQWLIDYCKSCDAAKNVVFVFVGKGWDNVVKELESIGCSYEWVNVSRKLPFEYQFQQNCLSCLNYYIYMGMDGGAMGTYDAYAQGVPLCVTFDGFHKSIPDLDYKFDDKTSFFSQMDLIISKHARRLDFFNSNSVDEYVKWLISVWEGKCENVVLDKDIECISYHTVLEKKRDQYYELKFSTLKKFLYYQWTKYLFRKRIK